MSKTKNKIRVKFVGTNAESVTGSCILIETEEKKILVECGLYQGDESLLQQYRINNHRFPFKVKDIDYLIVLHSHIDHVGLIPKLYKQGAHCQIIAPTGLKKLFEVMGKDSAFIMERDAEELTKKFGKKTEPIYIDSNVDQALEHWNEYERGEVITIDDDLKVKFVNSAHIINACQCELWVTNGNRTAKIAITSDLGNTTIQNDYVEDFQPIEKANLIIGEATYSREKRVITNKDRKKDLEKLKTVIEQTCIDNRAQVLVPVFALQRCQTILTQLYNIFKDDTKFNIPIILDSPLSHKITGIFLNELQNINPTDYKKLKEVMSWENIVIEPEFEGTQSWVESGKPCVFLSCSGMLTAGRAVYTAQKLMTNSRNHIIFCGYSNENSLATKIKNNQKTITIEGKQLRNRCGATQLLSFSSHMQRAELLDYYSKGNFDKIAVVHSEFDSKLDFCKDLQEKLSERNKSGKVICVNNATEILL